MQNYSFLKPSAVQSTSDGSDQSTFVYDRCGIKTIKTVNCSSIIAVDDEQIKPSLDVHSELMESDIKSNGSVAELQRLPSLELKNELNIDHNITDIELKSDKKLQSLQTTKKIKTRKSGVCTRNRNKQRKRNFKNRNRRRNRCRKNAR